MSVRPQLIHPLRERRGDRCTLVVASCRPEQRWLESRELSDLRELADLDLSGVAQGRAPGFGAPSDEPVVLVCTHGRRDVCCARRGRPVAKALDERLPGRVWETTHVGGDRFAANVVTLPHGTYHGGVTAEAAPALVATAVDRAVVLPYLRGTAGLPAVVQAAEYFVRREPGLTGLDDVRAADVAARGDACEDVQVRAGARWFSVRMRCRQVPDVRLTSCADGGAHTRPHVRELVGLVERSWGAVG